VFENGQLFKDSESPRIEKASCLDFAIAANGLSGGTLESLSSEVDRELAAVQRDYRNIPSPISNPHTPHFDDLLSRAIQCAVKQSMLLKEVCAQLFTDELTGLYNRRGFLDLAVRQLRLSCRAQREFMLFFIDVDDLKQINDRFGHSAGDLALIGAAKVLSQTFRDSDILGRLGGDEFAALAIETSGHNESAIVARMHESLESVITGLSPCVLSLSVGSVRFGRGTASSLEDLMREADRAMYEAKRNRRFRKAANVPARRFNGRPSECGRKPNPRAKDRFEHPAVSWDGPKLRISSRQFDLDSHGCEQS
jgi:diguanylate cyclase (GGDEF)-like protein